MLSFHHLPPSFPSFGWCKCNACFCSYGGRITALLLMGLQDKRDVAKGPPVSPKIPVDFGRIGISSSPGRQVK